MTITFDEDKSKQKIDALLRKEEEDLVQVLSGKYGVDYVSLAGQPVNRCSSAHRRTDRAQE